MHSFIVFTGKELKEQIVTFKGSIIGILLLLVGIASPLTAKLIPEIFKSVDMGVKFKIPDPTYIDAYAQFFKNVGQLILIVVLFVYSGIVVSELTKGTANLMLTKKLSRNSFIMSKFVSAFILWTAFYVISSALCVMYTYFLFPKMNTDKLLISFAAMWTFGVVTIAIAIFASSIFKSYAISAVGGFCIWGILLFVSSIPKVKKFMPGLLGTANMDIIKGTLAVKSLAATFLISAGLIILLLGGSCFALYKREI